MAPKASTLLAALTGAAAVSAHGHVSHIIVNGVQYRNYDPTSDFYNPGAAPKVIGWSALNQDNGFVEPNSFGTAEIICHKGAKPGAGHATVAAGDKINLVWTPEWPESHVGPVIDYLADCNGPCETVDPASLRFFKIGGAGYNGDWAANDLRANGNSWLVQIPSDLKPGNYVLRHEILALQVDVERYSKIGLPPSTLVGGGPSTYTESKAHGPSKQTKRGSSRLGCGYSPRLLKPPAE